MGTAQLVEDHDRQTLVLPADVRLVGPEIEVFRRGDEVVLREKFDNGYLRALELLSQLPPEIEERNDSPPQDRDFGG